MLARVAEFEPWWRAPPSAGLREAARESGLELSLGLPAYFTTKPAGVDGQELSGAGEFAGQPQGGSNGYEATKPAAAAAPVVGWPPVRSFRRNLSASKEDGRANIDRDVASKGADDRVGQKGLFVKVNMDGISIGRKVELKEHGSYADLSITVDKLFRSLLAVICSVCCCDECKNIQNLVPREEQRSEQLLLLLKLEKQGISCCCC